ncbi:nuclear transport factor 2 family protein [Nocardia sp. NPDC058176]|uniref:nuclear transport factor 2 family protein n=1 Tax=Nocardia sp. NPDC058176 TaxID=3346368 RepID=UPI0036DB2321
MTASSMTAKSVLENMYEAEARYLAGGGPGFSSFSLLAPYFATDVVLYQADNLPYGGTWRGHEGLERFFVAMSGVWDRFEMVEQTYLAETSPLVVLTHVRARTRSTGRELAFPILQTVTVDAGRISEIRPFYWDTAAIADACTP